MKLTCTLPDHALVVEALLEGFVRACQVIVAAGLAPADLLDSKVKYQLEPPGEEDWKLPQYAIRDGWADCEDLAGWRAGGLRATGQDPEARVVVVRTGRGKLHAVVALSDGSLSDPSRDLWTRQRTTLGAEPRGIRFVRGVRQRDSQGKTVAVIRDHTKEGTPKKPIDAPPAAQPTASWEQRAAEQQAYQDRRAEAAQKAGMSPDDRSFGRSTNRVTAASAEEAASKGLKFVDDHYERMSAEDREVYARDGYDPSGQYASAEEYDDAYDDGQAWSDQRYQADPWDPDALSDDDDGGEDDA